MSDGRQSLLQQFSLRELIEEAEREVFMRRRVFPSRVRQGVLDPRDADRRIDMMSAIAGHLRALAEAQK